MQFLTPTEWQAWCSKREILLREDGWIRPDLKAKDFHITDVPYRTDSGAKISLARFLYSLVPPDQDTLLLLADWAVWPSSQHMPLFTRFRQALGEVRTLIDSPGHLVSVADSDDAISVIATALLFFWDCYGISSSGRDAFFISHDEYYFFASRDPSVAAGR